MLIYVLFAMGIISIFRAIHIWTTGFFVTDEYLYIDNAFKSNIYSGRWFFGYLNIIFFRIFGIDNISKFVLFLPFYLFLWSAMALLSFYGILKAIKFNAKTIALSLFSSLFLVSFILLSAGFLTEPVGLGFSMLGIYFLVLYAKGTRISFIFPLLASLAFAAAGGAREPYYIFLLVGGIPVLGIALTRQRHCKHATILKKGFTLFIPALLFIGSAALFLEYPTPAFSGQIVPLIADVVNLIQTPAIYINQTTSVTSTATSTFVSTATQTTSVTSTATFTSVSTVTETTAVTESKSITFTNTQDNMPVARPSILEIRPINLLVIFVGGLILGWGPILFAIFSIGIMILLLKIKRERTQMYWLVLQLSVIALGSYLVVSYIFSSDASYFSFANYSTILRFSDTAMPAYFLLSPFAFSFFSGKKKYLYSIIAILLVFAILLIPVYQVYASSRVSLDLVSNPLTLDYRTPGVLIRDYALAHTNEEPFYILGFPSIGWYWTPGSTQTNSVHLFPYLPQDEFIKHKWSNFYVWSDSLTKIKERAPYLIPLLTGNPKDLDYSLPYRLVDTQVIFNQTGAGSSNFFVRIELTWTSTE
jgi:hypothetical protein